MATHKTLVQGAGLPGAVVLGLGSIIGTGAYVSVGLAAGMVGQWVVLALALAAVVAVCNGLSSAQLAAVHPVNGGTYEYGYVFLNPWFGFFAGWLFVVAKSASAATAALAVGWYIVPMAGVSDAMLIPFAAVLILGLGALVNRGLRRSVQANAVILLCSVGALLVFCGVTFFQQEQAPLVGPVPQAVSWNEVLAATALLFVAFTGYGRIATMGEEVRRPRLTIPRAMIVTLMLTALLYGLVAIAILYASNPVSADTSRFFALSDLTQYQSVRWLLLAGGVIAMLGVMLNLILGVSRVIMAMARRNDMPSSLAVLNAERTSPSRAVYLTTGLMVVFALVGDLRLTWAFSAFTVLIYYGITNLAALQVHSSQRFVPKVISMAGLLSCTGLIFFIDKGVFLVGLGTLAAGAVWFYWRRQK